MLACHHHTGHRRLAICQSFINLKPLHLEKLICWLYDTYILYILCIYVWTYIPYIRNLPRFLSLIEITPDFPSKPQFFANFSEPSKQQTLPRYSKERDQVHVVEQLRFFRVFCFKPAWENVGFSQKIIQKLDEIRYFCCFSFQTSTVGFKLRFGIENSLIHPSQRNCFMELSSAVFRLEILAKSSWHALSRHYADYADYPARAFWNVENDEVFQVLNPNLFQKVLNFFRTYPPWN